MGSGGCEKLFYIMSQFSEGEKSHEANLSGQGWSVGLQHDYGGGVGDNILTEETQNVQKGQSLTGQRVLEEFRCPLIRNSLFVCLGRKTGD